MMPCYRVKRPNHNGMEVNDRTYLDNDSPFKSHVRTNSHN